MWGVSAQLAKSSSGAVGIAVASHHIGHRPSESHMSAIIRTALETAPEHLDAALHDKEIEPEFVAYIHECNQWDLPAETASANVYQSLLVAPQLLVPPLIVNSFAVHRIYQPYLQNHFGWWCAPSQPGIFTLWGNQASVSASEQGCLSHLWYDALVSAGFLRVCDPQRVALEKIYHIEEPDAVAEFLACNTFLNDLLIEAHDSIVEFFGDGVEVYLELIDDPDFPGNPKLYSVIATPLTAKDAMLLQEQLDEAWWLNNLIRAQGKFNIIVEYV